MSSKNIQFHEGQSPMDRQNMLQADEIDLLDIFRILMNQKWLILGITVLCTFLAVVVALLLPRVYKTELIMMPSLEQTIEKLNVHNLENGSNPYFFQVNGQELYKELIDNLKSSRLQRRFYDENKLGQILTEENDTRPEDVIFDREFRTKLTVEETVKNNGSRGFITIRLEGNDPEEISDWLNKFVQMADEQTIIAQTQAFAMKARRVKDSVVEKISSLRSVEKSKRLDLIARLEEAISVANKLGWVEQNNKSGFQYEQAEMDAGNMSFSLQDIPLYLRGSKVLQAEIDVLRQRKNDDPFIPELRDLQEQYNFLSSVRQDAENVHAMRIDRAALVDDRPIKPKRKLFVVLGFVLGVLLSIFVAYVRDMVKGISFVRCTEKN